MRLSFILCTFLFNGLFAAELRYEMPNTAVVGVVKKKLVYGPPGYGEDPKHDKKVEIYLLETEDLNHFAKDPTDLTTQDESNIKEFQIIQEKDGINTERFLNKKVTVMGSFSHSISGGQHTNVILNTTTIREFDH